MKTRREQIEEQFEELTESEKIAVCNEYCDANNYCEDRCYFMEELDDLFCDCKPLDMLDKLCQPFDSRMSYFYDTIWGLESSEDDPISAGKVDMDILLDWIDENWDTFDLSDLFEIEDE